jgi:hypothetical protein
LDYNRSGFLLARGSTGGFKAIHLSFTLAAEPAIRSLLILILARTIIESGMGIDPYVHTRVALKMDDWLRRLGNT